MARSSGKSPFLDITAFMIIIHLCLFPVQCYVVGEESTYLLGELKVTHLHFFLQDFVTGRNPTAVRVAGRNVTNRPFPFSDVFVIDDPLTEAADSASMVVGNAQGIYAFTGREQMSVYIAADFQFTTGEFNGSSISIASRNPITEAARELAVVGGRGRFRLARGFALLATRLFVGLTAIVEYNVTVFHY